MAEEKKNKVSPIYLKMNIMKILWLHYCVQEDITLKKELICVIQQIF